MSDQPSLPPVGSTRLFQIQEEDLAELERIIPNLQDALMASWSTPVRKWLEKAKRILSDVRWSYGPFTKVETLPAEDPSGAEDKAVSTPAASQPPKAPQSPPEINTLSGSEWELLQRPLEGLGETERWGLLYSATSFAPMAFAFHYRAFARQLSTEQRQALVDAAWGLYQAVSKDADLIAKGERGDDDLDDGWGH